MKFKKYNITIILIILVIISLTFILGFTKSSNLPNEVYKVYLDGEEIGLIKSKSELEDYINKEQTELKKLYNTDKVYAPNGLEIKKYITYNEKINSPKQIYDKIKDLRPFTINCYVVNIRLDEDTKEIYILDKDIFKEAVDKTIKAFIDENEYNRFINEMQDEIKDTGLIIEDIYLKEEVTIKESHISVDKDIFTNVEDLTKYLLYGTTEKQDTYVVKPGDTISKISEANNLNVKEFLVANPEFTSENNLLFTGQEVVVGLIKPQINVVMEQHVVSDRTKLYETEIRYDSTMVSGQTRELQTGEDGLERITEKVQITNGQLTAVVVSKKEELKPSVNRVYVKGSMVIPDVGETSSWGWPTKSGWRITSGYEYRWGTFHRAIDISGTGYGSPIYATNNGTVAKVFYDSTGGNQIWINHNNGFYSEYAHLATQYVKEGDIVARGQAIGAMGRSGYVVGTSGVHLHFGIWTGEPHRASSANPCKYVRCY